MGCLSPAPGSNLPPVASAAADAGRDLDGGMWNLLNGPSGDWPDDLDERLAVDVVTVSGSAATVEFLIHANAVEVWFQEQCRAVLNRWVLRGWLANPHAPLVVDEVTLSPERTADFEFHQGVLPGRIALSLPGVLVWPLAPHTLADLRCRV
jgi:hypothetical protein